MVVAIDGPAGSGKTTTARQAAARLGFVHIDTGAMYRAVTLKALRTGADLSDDAALTGLSAAAVIELSNQDGAPSVMLDGTDVTRDIRTPEIDRNVSRVSEVEGVRTNIVEQQRRMAQHIDVVMEGRDIGTVVFPDAQVKVFLVASLEERARRRLKELNAKGMEERLDAVYADLERRDKYDSSRAVAPLKPASDAIPLDTTSLSIEQQVEQVVSYVMKQRESQ